jgi:hypothetical protein
MDPVFLTKQQIDEIINEIPEPPGIGRTALKIARGHLVDRVRTILEGIKLIPKQEAFEEFKSELIESLYQSYIEPGTPVGITAGVSLGGPVTQLSLNSFHFAGAQSGVALAFQKIRDFLTGSKMNRNPQMKIYFKVPYVGSDLHEIQHVGTFDSIMAMRHEFEQTLVSDVVIDSHILKRDEAKLAGVPQMISLQSYIRPERFEGSDIKFPLTHVIEIKLNTYRMFTHKITMAMVARAIEGVHPNNIPIDSLTCVWQSQIDGRMYILVDESRNYGQGAMKQDVAILMFLSRYVMRQYNQWKISGITGIVSIEPQEIDVLKGIYRIKSLGDGIHRVYTNNRKTRWDGISLADIYRVIKAAGFNVRKINKQELYLVVDNYFGDLEKELNNRVQEAQNKVAIKRTPEENSLANVASFYYALTNGSNMKEIVWRDDIDLFRTISNYSHEIYDMLGIDAARIYLIFRFMQTLQDFSSYINPRHISLIFDLLCNLGIINSLSFVGINRRRFGPLVMSTHERALEVFVNSATFGDKEAITGASAAIYTGQKPKRMGTGSIAIEEDLSIIPVDGPSMPSINEDEIWNDDMIDINLFKKTKTKSSINMSIIPGSVDKTAIQTNTKITNQHQYITESLIPSGSTVMTPSDTLVKVLQKVSTGTGLIIESKEIPPVNVIPNIPEALPQRGKPEPLQPILDVLSKLKTVPNAGIPSPVSQNIQIPLPPIKTPKVSQSSFINLLPDLTSVTLPESETTTVPYISVSNVMNIMTTPK